MTGLFACLANAQLGEYLGPAIMSRGATGIGTRGGQTVDLRFFVSVNATYDNGFVPIATNTSGQLVDPGGQVGIEGQVGAYGSHSWRRANLSLDYHGDYRHYNQTTYFDGSDQQLLLGYTYQKSRKLQFDFRGLAGTYSQGFGGVAGVTPIDQIGGINPTTGILFDNRSTFLQGGMDVTYLKSARNSFTAGGQGYDVMRHSQALVGMHGYTLHGTFEHRLSMTSSVALVYTHYHYDYPHAFGESTSDSLEAGFTTGFNGRRWTLKVLAGGLQTEVEGVQTVALDPVVASILGVGTTVQAYYRKSIIPSGNASLSRRFKTSNLTFYYTQGIAPGNGVYLTSRQSSGGAGYSYTGVRKTSLTIDGAYNSYSSLGQTLTPYHYFGAGASASYEIMRTLHVTARYDARQQDIDQSYFKKTSYRVSLGIAFSPGDIPLSIW